jgi:nitrite reductase/ring-hydroxylating ferredoxin subunit
MEFIKVAVINDFETKEMKSLSVLGKKVGVFKRDDGSFYAIETGCKHQGADLLKGKIEFGRVTCPRHGWEYDLETGECTNNDSTKLRKYAVKIEGNDIKISIRPID